MPDLAARPDRTPLIKGPESPDGLQVILGTADLGVGLNRFGYLLVAPDGVVSLPTTSVFARFVGEAAGDAPPQAATAEYHAWPYGQRGLYTTDLTFDRPGPWAVDIVVEGPDGSRRTAELFFEVLDAPSALAVGAPAFRSESKTLDDVESIAQLSTGSLQDPDLYRLTIADAVTNGRPTVIVFASPAFCTNEVCGPQVDVLKALKDRYRGLANFVHVDFYDNPGEFQDNPDLARVSPTVFEWGLPSLEWSFVIDRDGVVVARFEAFATFDEIEAALVQAL